MGDNKPKSIHNTFADQKALKEYLTEHGVSEDKQNSVMCELAICTARGMSIESYLKMNSYVWEE